MVPRPGQIFWAETRDGDKRPWIVVSREELNRGKYCVAIPLTTRRVDERKILPHCVFFEQGEFGLPRACVAQAESLSLLAIDEELNLEAGPIGQLSPEKHRELLKAIGHMLDADIEPM